ncbi:Protein of unknown function [Catalinimonas alkaloidigena]|uniref:DUF4230 domain-containing protein n=1 Tax=Catalinimonas alkaloidigena TaxID=1075417 RepID=A0A1G9SHS2_9BACT|nr:DUF4230 domain-containing protein [Catalinimonas alkaloidigena]SDM35058.1 Protein of unknown function [Catalinimonas alkaloidigena]
MKTPSASWSALIGLLLGLIACQPDERGLVVGKIQQASDLATTEFTVDKIVHGTKTRKFSWFLKLSEARFLAYSQATVKTGIDLGQIAERDVEIEGKRITLRLPPVKVINFSYPPAGFVEDSLISDPKAFLNKISLDDQEEFFRQAELDIRNNLAYMGVVETTQQHTRALLTQLLRALGYREIYISFQSDALLIDPVNVSGEEEGND